MAKFLMFSHGLLFLLCMVIAWRNKTRLLCCMAIPAGAGFLYTSVYQAKDALAIPAIDLNEHDMVCGLLVSLASYLALLVGYWMVRREGKTVWLKDSNIDIDRVNRLGLLLFGIGLVGHLIFMQTVGGFSSYFGSNDWAVDNPYEMSGYVYNLRYGILGAVVMWFISGTLRRQSVFFATLFFASLGFLIFQGVLDTSRGETVRSILLLIGYIYFASYRWEPGVRVLAYISILLLVMVAALAVVTLPSFRDQGRKITSSETTMAEALQESKGHNRAEMGGEFDSGVRIIKRINNGDIKPHGPIHIARFLWNAVPRALVPDKHEIFERWAGNDYNEMRIGSTAYYGCAPTGWGEAYGTMGVGGALIYWFLFGMALKWLEIGMGQSIAAVVITASFYLPMMQYVGIDFWVGSLGLCITTIPVVFLLVWFCRKSTSADEMGRGPQKRKNYYPAKRLATGVSQT